MLIALALLIGYFSKPGLEEIIHNKTEMKAYQQAIKENNMTKVTQLAEKDSDGNKTKYDLIMKSEQKKKERLIPRVRERLDSRLNSLFGDD